MIFNILIFLLFSKFFLLSKFSPKTPIEYFYILFNYKKYNKPLFYFILYFDLLVYILFFYKYNFISLPLFVLFVISVFSILANSKKILNTNIEIKSIEEYNNLYMKNFEERFDFFDKEEKKELYQNSMLKENYFFVFQNEYFSLFLLIILFLKNSYGL